MSKHSTARHLSVVPPSQSAAEPESSTRLRAAARALVPLTAATRARLVDAIEEHRALVLRGLLPSEHMSVPDDEGAGRALLLALRKAPTYGAAGMFLFKDPVDFVAAVVVDIFRTHIAGSGQ